MGSSLWLRLIFSSCLILLVAGLPSAMAQSGQPLGRYIDTAEYDDSGDSGYNSFIWCGERLWLNGNSGMVVVDPAAGKASHSLSVGPDPFSYDLMGCTGSDNRMVMLLDHTRERLVWKTLDGKRDGEIFGVHRGRDNRQLPLITMDGTAFVGISADDNPLHATALPPGYRLISIAPATLKSFADVEKAVGLNWIRHNLFSLDLGSGQVLLEIDASGREPKIAKHRNLSDIVPLGHEYFLSYPKPDGVGFVVRAWSSTAQPLALAAQFCRIENLWQTPVQTVCHPPTPAEQTIGDRISAKLLNETLLVSPSGRWAVWGEQIEGDQDRNLSIYVAPTADLLKP